MRRPVSRAAIDASFGTVTSLTTACWIGDSDLLSLMRSRTQTASAAWTGTSTRPLFASGVPLLNEMCGDSNASSRARRHGELARCGRCALMAHLNGLSLRIRCGTRQTPLEPCLKPSPRSATTNSSSWTRSILRVVQHRSAKQSSTGHESWFHSLQR